MLWQEIRFLRAYFLLLEECYLQKMSEVKKMRMNIGGLISFIGILAIAIVDLGLVVFGGTGLSVSAFLISHGFSSPIFVFAVGCTCGHLFFYMWPEEQWSLNDVRAERKRQLITAICTMFCYEALRRLIMNFL